MKKLYRLTLASIFATLCCGSVAYGQSDHDNPDNHAANGVNAYDLYLGVKLGLALANQATSEPPINSDFDSTYKPGLTWGALLRVAIIDKPEWAPRITLGAQSEVLFVPKGLNVDRDGETLGGFYFDYVEIPLLARASIAATSTIHPYLTVGPALSILYSAELENSLGDRSNIKSRYTNTDVGLVFSAGTSVDIPAIRGAVTLDVRYDFGLRDITGIDGFVKNRVFAFTLAYEYRIR